MPPGRSDSTVDIDYFKRGDADAPVPGVVLLFSGEEPKCGPLALEGGELVLGRNAPAQLALEDAAMSRRHVRIFIEGAALAIEDLGSRNGVVVDGVSVAPGARAAAGGRVLRAGRTIFLVTQDVRAWLARPLHIDGGQVIGPVIGRVWDEIDALSASEVLHVNAESGAGKELAARRFHARGAHAAGPFVAVNCAAIPHGVADRLLFGTKKGAFSGATENADGYFQAASGGTLFLDEVAELEPEVQAKLLRVLETHEVMPLGAARPVRVDVRVVSATHRDMRAAVSGQRFREDLFFRMCRPSVTLPPLRERPEEIAWHALAAARGVKDAPPLSAAFVEACLLREWPGNVRELLQEVEDAARRAARARAPLVEPEHLDDLAGHRASGAAAETDAADATARSEREPRQLPDDAIIEAALVRSDGRVATAARELGVHRTQLRRWIERRRAPAS